MKHTNNQSNDFKILDQLHLTALNMSTIDGYRRVFEHLHPNHEWTLLTTEDFLLKINAIGMSSVGTLCPTVGGLLMFGYFDSIKSIFPNFFMEFKRHIIGYPVCIPHLISGDASKCDNLFDFFYTVYPHFVCDVEKPFQLDENSLRVDVTPVHKAMAGLLWNTLIHSDYSGEGGIIIEQRYKNIVISTPGKFGIPIEDVFLNPQSKPVNQNIYNMFSLMHDNSSKTRDLKYLLDTWQEYGFPMPIIEQSSNPERVTISICNKCLDC